MELIRRITRGKPGNDKPPRFFGHARLCVGKLTELTLLLINKYFYKQIKIFIQISIIFI